jgi:hypothetical protein
MFNAEAALRAVRLLLDRRAGQQFHQRIEQRSDGGATLRERPPNRDRGLDAYRVFVAGLGEQCTLGVPRTHRHALCPIQFKSHAFSLPWSLVM